MRAATAPAAWIPQACETLEAVLGPNHDAWVEEARQLIAPDGAGEASLWHRWRVVRYLNDRFSARFRLERELVSELRPFGSARDLEILDAGADRVASLSLGLDRLSRRRGTATEVARLGREFVAALGLWCAEIELVGARVGRDMVSEQAQRVLATLEGGFPVASCTGKAS